MSDYLGSDELIGRRWYSLLLPARLDLESESESEASQSESEVEDSDSELESMSAKTQRRAGDVVLFLNSVDEYMSREQETQQLLFIAIFLICYRRNLFPHSSFKNVFMPSLGMRIKQLIPDEEDFLSFRFMCWLKGVYDATKKNYMKGLWLRIFDDQGTMEEYCFSFSCRGEEERRSAQQQDFNLCASTMIRTLEDLWYGFREFPTERTLFTSVLLNDVAPANYEPSWFRGWEFEEEESQSFLKENSDIQSPPGTIIVIDNRNKMKLTLKVRTILDALDSSTDDEVRTDLDALDTSTDYEGN